MMKSKNFDNNFREKLDGFSAPPPPGVWEGVQGQLASLRRKKRRMLYGWISAAAVVVMALLAGWYFNQNQVQNIPVVTDAQQVEEPVDETKNMVTSETEQTETIENNKAESVKSEIKETTDVQNPQILPAKNLIAEVSKENVETIQTVSEQGVERFSLNFINRLEFLFESVSDYPVLRKMKKEIPVRELTDIEKNLIAENIKTTQPATNETTGWRMGMHVSPGYASHTAQHADVYVENMTYSGTEGSNNVGGGISIQYKTGKRLRIESGVYYSQNGQRSNSSKELFALNRQADLDYSAPEKSYFGNAVNVSNGDMTMNSTAGVIAFSNTPEGAEVAADFESQSPGFSNTLLSTGEFSQVFDFVEIPLYLRYSVVDRKIGVEVMGGLNAGLVVGNNAYIDNEYGLQNIGQTEDILPVNLSGTVGLGINYSLGKHLAFAVEPRVNYFLNSINSNPAVDFKPYRIGVYTGIYYEF